MAQFNPDSYATVDQRIAEFYRDWPEGSIRTRMVFRDGPEVIFEARAYRTREDVAGGIYGSGWAREVEGGSSPVLKTSHLEVCETSAIGRALANLGYSGHINGKRAPRPSREEMTKAERRKDSGKAERYAARIRELAIEIDGERDRTGEYKETMAQHDAEAFLTGPDCNTAMMEKFGNRLGEELARLKSLPAMAVAPTYETFQAPGMNDGDDRLPSD